MNEKDFSFKLDDLDDVFWSKVIFIQIYNTTSMGGPGCIFLITNEKELYFISFRAFLPYNEFELDKFHPIFKKNPGKKDGYRTTYVAEDAGWSFSKRGCALIKNEYFDEFERILRDVYGFAGDDMAYLYSHGAMEKVLGAKDGFKRYDEENAIKVSQEMREILFDTKNETSKKNLVAEHFVWKPIYSNNVYSKVSKRRMCTSMFKSQRCTCGTVYTLLKKV